MRVNHRQDPQQDLAQCGEFPPSRRFDPRGSLGHTGVGGIELLPKKAWAAIRRSALVARGSVTASMSRWVSGSMGAMLAGFAGVSGKNVTDIFANTLYFPSKSLIQVLAELPAFTVAERQLLVRRAIELDEPPLTAADENLVRNRFAEHERDPSTAIPFDAMKKKLRAAFPV